MKFEYLTDEELNSLIADIEQNEMVSAPPDMVGSVFNQISEKDKIIEFRRFKARVIIAVAAIVAFVMVVPRVTRNITQETVAVRKVDITISDSGWLRNLGSSHYISDFVNKRGE